MIVADAPGFVVNRVLTRVTRVLLDALENGNRVEETDEAMLSLGMPMAPSVVLQMVGPRVANHVLETMHEAYPDRFPLSPTLAGFADGSDEVVLTRHATRTVEQIREDDARGGRRRDPPPARRGRRRRGRGRRHGLILGAG